MSYEEKFGKTVSRNSVYIVSSKSVLGDSSVTKTSDGYTISMNLDISNLPSGIYTIFVTQNNQKAGRRMLVNR